MVTALVGILLMFASGVIPSVTRLAVALAISCVLATLMFVVNWERLPKWLEVGPPLGYILVLVWIRELSPDYDLATMTVSPLLLFALFGVALHGTRSELVFVLVVVTALLWGPGLVRGIDTHDAVYKTIVTAVWSTLCLAAHAHVRALHESQDSQRRILDVLAVGVAVIREGAVVYANPRLVKLVGDPRDPLSLFQDEHRSRLSEYLGTAAAQRSPLAPFDARVRASGEALTVNVSMVPLAFDRAPAVALMLRDVSSERRVEETERQRHAVIAAERRRMNQLLECIDDGVAILDWHRDLVYANGAYKRVLGLEAVDLDGLSREALVAHLALSADDPEAFRTRFEAQDIGSNGAPMDFTLRDRVLRRITYEIGEGYVVVWRDVTAEAHQRHLLERQAVTDLLTGLPNRRAMEEVLARERARARRQGTPVCVALFDLDHFKRINDEHGHACGDEVLRRVAVVLTSEARTTDAVGRWGGEELWAVLPGPLDGATVFCERVRVAIANLAIDALPAVTISAGVAEIRPDEETAVALERADRSLYEAKRGGRNQVRTATT
ncbi:MAG: sensor domain-containing diguanylate cyclase [Myxococcales bacterium]|nr:sensor domain-containing diguanylate cyclase [Myxococcales bacterium]